MFFCLSGNGASMLFEVNMRELQVQFVSDASGLWGCGIIAAVELLPVLVAAALWGRQWWGFTVCSHCDNEAVMASIQGNFANSPTWLI